METQTLFAYGGSLEVREQRDGTHRLAGSFPYNTEAVLSDAPGRALKERIGSRAFRERIEAAGEDIHLLAGHDFNRPLASKLSGSLTLRDTDEALHFEATLPPAVAGTGHGRDALALIASGLSRGVSPGFLVPDAPDAEHVVRDEDGIMRTVKRAQLFELSVVTRPVYARAQIQAREWTPHCASLGTILDLTVPHLRWR